MELFALFLMKKLDFMQGLSEQYLIGKVLMLAGWQEHEAENCLNDPILPLTPLI